MNEKIKRIVVCCKWVCLLSGMICLTTGSSTNHWQGNDSSHEGLWEMCTKKFGCSSIKFKGSKDGQGLEKLMIIVRVCLLIGVLAGSIASIMLAIGTFYRDVFLIIAFIPEFMQTVLCTFAMKVYTTDLAHRSYSFQYSFILAFVGAGLFVINFFSIIFTFQILKR